MVPKCCLDFSFRLHYRVEPAFARNVELSPLCRKSQAQTSPCLCNLGDVTDQLHARQSVPISVSSPSSKDNWTQTSTFETATKGDLGPVRAGSCFQSTDLTSAQEQQIITWKPVEEPIDRTPEHALVQPLKMTNGMGSTNQDWGEVSDAEISECSSGTAPDVYIFELVSQLMALEDVNRGILSTAGPGNVAASNKRPGRAAAADSSPQKSSSALGKRRARDLNEKEEESSEEREDKPRRYPRNEPESDGLDVSWDRLWACPFNKRDPVRFSEQNQNPSEKRYRHCGVAILRDINRVK